MDRTMSTLATGGLVAVILGFAFREIGENLLGPEAGRVHPQRRRHHCGIPSPGGRGAAGTGPRGQELWTAEPSGRGWAGSVTEAIFTLYPVRFLMSRSEMRRASRSPSDR